MFIIYYLLSLFTFFIFSIYYSRRKQKVLWNKGISPYTQKPWELHHKTMYSRVYKDKLNNYITLYYKVDSKQIDREMYDLPW